MKNIKIKKSILILALLCFASLFLCGTTLFAKAADVKPTMESGAYVRITDENDHNGIKFVMKIPASQYNEWKAEQDKTVSFGMLIAPASYIYDIGELTEENVFGSSAKYDYAVYNESTKKYEYSGNNGATVDGAKTRVRIVNVVGNDAFIDSKDSENMYFHGSLTNVKDANIARDFVGRGYVLIEDGDNKQYVFSDYSENGIADNTRSMFVVALKAIANNNDSSEWLSQYYVNNSNALDSSSAAVKVYKDTSTDYITVNGLNKISGVYDSDGTEITYTIEGDNKIRLSTDFISSVESDKVVYVLGATDNGYKAYKYQVSAGTVTLVSTVDDLKTMRVDTSDDKYYKLENDIDMSGVTLDTLTTDAVFNATFDGNSKTISNITYSSATSLFYTIKGTVKDLTLDNVSIGSGIQSGALAMELNEATIDNVYAEIDFGSSNHSGGLSKTLSNSVTIKDSVISVMSTITNNSGTFFAFINGTIDANNVTFENSYAISFVDTTANIVGGRGETYEASRDVINALNTDQNVIVYKSIDVFETAKAGGTVTIKNEAAYNKVTANVGTVDDLKSMRVDTSIGKYYRLENDIDMSGVTLDAISGRFSATFDGNGKAISNLTYNTAAPLFGTLSGTVKNLTFDNVSIGSGVQSGALALNIDGATIDNVYVEIDFGGSNHSGGLSKALTNSVTVKNTVINVTSTITNNSGTFFGFSGTSNVTLENSYAISADTTANIVGGRADQGYDTYRDAINALNTNKNVIVYKSIEEFEAAKASGTVTVKNETAYQKITKSSRDTNE